MASYERTYTIRDNCNGNMLEDVNKWNVVEKMTDWWDTSQEGVVEAIENIEAWMCGVLDEPEWGSDFLNVTISEC